MYYICNIKDDIVYLTKEAGEMEGQTRKVTVFNVADWFLSKQSMTPKKLQKLVYYAYAWYLTLVNEGDNDLNAKLFESRVEAWVHGPVFPELYKKYKRYSGETIPMYEGELIEFNEDALDILSQVLDVYGGYTGNQLESITHQESPWVEARGNCGTYDVCTNEITDLSIFRYYIKRVS